LLTASSLCVPELRVGVEKHWWTPGLEDLKHECIEQTNIWRLNGCPRSGVFNENRIKAKLRYKCAIKAVIAVDEDFNEDLVNHLCKKNFNGFGKAWSYYALCMIAPDNCNVTACFPQRLRFVLRFWRYIN